MPKRRFRPFLPGHGTGGRPSKITRKTAGVIIRGYKSYFSSKRERERLLAQAGFNDLEELSRTLHNTIGEKAKTYMEKLEKGEIFVLGLMNPRGITNYVVVPENFLSRAELFGLGVEFKNKKFVTISQFETFLMKNPFEARQIQELIARMS